MVCIGTIVATAQTSDMLVDGKEIIYKRLVKIPELQILEVDAFFPELLGGPSLADPVSEIQALDGEVNMGIDLVT